MPNVSGDSWREGEGGGGATAVEGVAGAGGGGAVICAAVRRRTTRRVEGGDGGEGGEGGEGEYETSRDRLLEARELGVGAVFLLGALGLGVPGDSLSSSDSSSDSVVAPWSPGARAARERSSSTFGGSSLKLHEPFRHEQHFFL